MNQSRRERHKRRARVLKFLWYSVTLLACCAIFAGGWQLLQHISVISAPSAARDAYAQEEPITDQSTVENSEESNLDKENQTEISKDAEDAEDSPEALTPTSTPDALPVDDIPVINSDTPAIDEETIFPAAPAADEKYGEAEEETPTIIPENASELVDDPGDLDVGEMRLSGIRIGIDPGHQAKANNGQEPIAPGSSSKKPKVSSGTAGVKTRTAEHVVNLEISFKLRDALEAEGAEVFMTRETADVNISNIERAVMMNELGVELVLRLHCNGSTNQSAHGIGLYVRKTGTNADECLKAAQALMPQMISATGAREDGIFRNDTYSGLNWSEVPSILVEMGFMSNPAEDVLLGTPEYQDKLVSGMVEGIVDYCLDGKAPESVALEDED